VFGPPSSSPFPSKLRRAHAAVKGISRSEVSRICKVLDEEVKAFLARPISEEHPHLWLDATVRHEAP
jgi:transposase-like protein